MPSERGNTPIVVFDIGGTWFRCGLYEPFTHELSACQRVPAINYLSHPTLSAEELQSALVEFILMRVQEMSDGSRLRPHAIGISVGAPLNAHSGTVLGSGPLWGETAQPFHLGARLREARPDLEWHIVNDVAALLARYMEEASAFRKTLLITVSSGIGSRLYDHRTGQIPYDSDHGLQGEIGHLAVAFALDGKLINRRCECGGLNHLNAFSSGRGIGYTLRTLHTLSPDVAAALSCDPAELWQAAGDGHRLSAFQAQLASGSLVARDLLEACVTPLTRILATALALDPEIDRLVMTGGVIHGLGAHYKEALEQCFLREGLYQITERDPRYLARRLRWDETDDFAGLRGAGLYSERIGAARASGPPAAALSRHHEALAEELDHG